MDILHLGKRLEGLALCLGKSLARPNVTPRIDFCFMRQRRASRVKHHSFRPFMIRVDPDVDPLVQRNLGR
jgi:hypothetical protein